MAFAETIWPDVNPVQWKIVKICHGKPSGLYNHSPACKYCCQPMAGIAHLSTDSQSKQ